VTGSDDPRRDGDATAPGEDDRARGRLHRPGDDEAPFDAALDAIGVSAPVADPLVVEEAVAELDEAARLARSGRRAGGADDGTDEGVAALYAKLRETAPGGHDRDADAGGAGRRAGPWARWKERTTQGAPFFPLGILFGLNAVDELDRTAFGVLLPEIRDHFGLDTSGILTVVSLSLVAALILALPIGFYGDRGRRTLIARGGATVWGGFSLLTAAAQNLWVLGVARAGSGLGRAVNDPTHNSLLADYYDIPARPRVYAVHRYANALGQFLGPLAGGLLAYSFGWRSPFVVFAIVTGIFVVLSLRLREPVRGRYERQAMGVSAEVADTEEEPPSWAESFRIIWQVRTLQRIFVALPFVAVAVVGLAVLSGLYYDEVWGFDERARGFTAAGLEGVAQFVGLMYSIPLATRLMAKGPDHVLRFLGTVSFAIAALWVVFALSPVLPLALAANALLSAGFFLLIPGIYVVLSLAVPAKVRSFGYAIGTLFVLPGLVILPFIGWIADEYSIRTGLLVAAPVFVTGGLILASAGRFVKHDIAQVWRSTAARSEVAHLRRQGKVKLLLGRDIDVHYDNVQVLFGVNFEIDEGEIVALMGTNGAGKSTLLKAIAGLVQASAGAIVFDGRDMTHTPPDEIAGRGVSVVPGGQGVFTHLSVADNLRLAGWNQRRSGRAAEAVRADNERVLDMFPVLRERVHEPAGNLSGGQQQMLTLGMAFIGKPRLLMIDELSLGLAPAVIGQLLQVVRELRDAGTTVILVEQSVNVALTVADRAYFMEKGEIRFEGPTAELLERPDLLRSVFLRAAAAEVSAETADEAAHSAVRDGEPVLAVRDVTRRFGGLRALDGVSFDVRPGEILGFIGPNGAGKTTLFDVISGYTPADAGTIQLRTHGRLVDLHDAPTHVRSWRGLGRSFQDGRLFPGLTVHEAIAVALEQHVEVRDPVAAALRLPSVSDSEEHVHARVDELIELLALDAYRDKFVRELSTGTRRVVDLACVLAQGPSVLLLDEPSSGIAQREAEALAPMLRRVRDQLGASLLVIEHDLPLLGQISDRMIALDLGRVVAEGTPTEVIEHPAVVASYLGTDESAITRSGSTEKSSAPTGGVTA
jgi:ABC-type branched-subunit amino acid transport system ATPase component/MFS family permease